MEQEQQGQTSLDTSFSNTSQRKPLQELKIKLSSKSLWTQPTMMLRNNICMCGVTGCAAFRQETNENEIDLTRMITLGQPYVLAASLVARCLLLLL